MINEEGSLRYVNFINRIAKGENFSQFDEAVTLFAQDCRKVFNGQTVAKSRDEFVRDLLSVYANFGGWKMLPLEFIKAADNSCTVIRFLIETERLGTNTAIVILRYDENSLITEINEVFSPVKESYDFQK